MLIDPQLVEELQRLCPPAAARPGARRRGPRDGAGALFRTLRRNEARKVPRLERLFLRLLQHTNAPIALLVDASSPMTYAGSAPPAPSEKFDYARKLAATVGYAGLLNGVKIQCLGLSTGRSRRVPTIRGADDSAVLLSYLEGMGSGGDRRFGYALRQYLLRAGADSLCVVLSDFRSRHWERELHALLLNRTQASSPRVRLALIHLVDRSELETPSPELPEVEDDDEFPIGENDPALARKLRNEDRMRERVPGIVGAPETVRARLHELAAEYPLEYIPLMVGTPFEESLLRAVTAARR